MSTENQVVLITGAAKRIGRNIAHFFHERGHSIAIHYNHSYEEAKELHQTFNQSRAGSAIMIQANLNHFDDIKRLAEQTYNWKKRLNILVNNASTYFPKQIGETSLSDWENLFNSNAKAPFFLVQQVFESLKTNHGSIINIIDSNLDRPIIGYSAYQMAKASLAMMTEVLAKELAPDIRVNGVSPGAILWAEHENETMAENILNAIPLNRVGSPQDIAEAVYFLSQAQYITGQILNVDGGKSL